MNDVVQIKKYPNRRLYDQTHSRHLTQDQLHELVSAGRRVRITDSTSGRDITNAVLMQVLVDRDPSRLAAIPCVCMHLLLQGQDALVRRSLDQSMRWMGLEDEPGPADEGRPTSSSRPGSVPARPAGSPEDEVAMLRSAISELLGQLRTVESRLAELEHRSAGPGEPASGD